MSADLPEPFGRDLQRALDAIDEIMGDPSMVLAPAQMRAINYAFGLPRNVDEDMAAHCQTCGANLKTLAEMDRHDAKHTVIGYGMNFMVSFWQGLPEGELRSGFWKMLFAGQDAEYVRKARARISELAAELEARSTGERGPR